MLYNTSKGYHIQLTYFKILCNTQNT